MRAGAGVVAMFVCVWLWLGTINGGCGGYCCCCRACYAHLQSPGLHD